MPITSSTVSTTTVRIHRGLPTGPAAAEGGAS